jgi:hypothetical protein
MGDIAVTLVDLTQRQLQAVESHLGTAAALRPEHGEYVSDQPLFAEIPPGAAMLLSSMGW